MLFSELGIHPKILQALAKQGYETPTPIQEKAIPSILAGKDFMGAAQTGTGKTAAFAIPTLQLLATEGRLENRGRTIKSLILTPTRELAIQIEENIVEYGQNLNLKHAVIFGGVKQGSQVAKLKSGVDILVATPGRLLDLMQQGYIDLRHIEIFTLDEADRMLNMGFINDVRKVIAALPAKKQTLLFSATMPKEIVHLADGILHNPIKVEVTPVSSTAEKVSQGVFFVKKSDKKLLLQEILKNEKMTSVLIFTRTKHGADRVVKDLDAAGISAAAIHGNKSQNNRQRALENFKSEKIRVLVATDIAARGIDIDELMFVINYELPNEPETYVHRIGRTGRAGKDGVALSFCDREEFEYLMDIEKLTGQKIRRMEKHPYHVEIKGPISNAEKKKINAEKEAKKQAYRKENPRNFGRGRR
ncbi:DEAD/DEAH box helicase [Candidatus Gracilibacteria bacterium]|nr:DEAD/DEAH box helicase [Candidatus Gracilibacteria bacterium]